MKCRYLVTFTTRRLYYDFMENNIITIEVENPDNLGSVALLLQEKLKKDCGPEFFPALVNFWRL